MSDWGLSVNSLAGAIANVCRNASGGPLCVVLPVVLGVLTSRPGAPWLPRAAGEDEAMTHCRGKGGAGQGRGVAAWGREGNNCPPTLTNPPLGRGPRPVEKVTSPLGSYVARVGS